MTNIKPTILVAATSRWFATARLAMALTNAGCDVEAVCLPRHTVRKISVVRKVYTYDCFAPLASFADAIAAAKPDLIIPCDDTATRHLYSLYQRELRKGATGQEICALIERSLGAPENFQVTFARTASMETAREEGIRVPKTQVIANIDDLKKWAEQTGFPAVLKADCTTGGEGVRVVHSLEDAERTFRALQAPPLVLRAVKRALMDQDTSLLRPSFTRTKSTVNAQEFIVGREATSLMVCWKGAVLACLHFEVLKKRDSAGPATVLRWIDDADMKSTAEKMAKRLKLSGMHGFDFMLEAETGKAYLIELNPRATQVGHLTLGAGRDLPAALYSAITGKAVQESPKVTENDTIVLFPQEWIRNPTSAFLRSGYHDVPLEEPELVRACLSTRQKRKAWYLQEKWQRAFSADRARRP
jgi:formate-dependent phosphoribosylglycinamide formyltransferase (GAR transformylase)